MVIPFRITTLIEKNFTSTKIHHFFSFINFNEVTILKFLRENFSQIRCKFHFFQKQGNQAYQITRGILRCDNYVNFCKKEQKIERDNLTKNPKINEFVKVSPMKELVLFKVCSHQLLEK